MSGLKQDVTAEEKAFIYLCACGLHQTGPDLAQLMDTDWPRLFYLAKGQKLSALCASALEETKADSFPAPDILAKFREELALSIRRTILFDQERKKVTAFLEDSRIWYMPLKGSILKDLYPSYGVRQMADIDILIDPEGAAKVQEWFEGRGYEKVSGEKNKHDVYQKKPVYNIEMHRLLMDESDTIWYRYYKDVKTRLIKDRGSSFGYSFTDEDFYIYMMAHFLKHYKRSGTGFRALTDIYVYSSRKPGLDWDYINEELTKLGICQEGRILKELAMKLLKTGSRPNLDNCPEDQAEVLKKLLRNGAYGTTSNRVSNKLADYQKNGEIRDAAKVKRRYAFDRLFPDNEVYRQYYAPFYKHWWGRFFLPFYRLGRAVFSNPKKLLAEIKALIKIRL